LSDDVTDAMDVHSAEVHGVFRNGATHETKEAGRDDAGN
jgi:hypothetical protein